MKSTSEVEFPCVTSISD